MAITDSARLMAITDCQTYGVEHTLERTQKLCALARPGTVVVQMRDHGLSIRDRLDVGRALRDRSRDFLQSFVVNDRLDLALELGADGVHLGDTSVDVATARRLLGAGAFVSQACHELAALRATEGERPSAYLLSPVFAERKSRPELGERVFSEAVRAARPARVFALGGVDAAGAARVHQQQGGVAAMGAIFERDEIDGLLGAMDCVR